MQTVYLIFFNIEIIFFNFKMADLDRDRAEENENVSRSWHFHTSIALNLLQDLNSVYYTKAPRQLGTSTIMTSKI